MPELTLNPNIPDKILSQLDEKIPRSAIAKREAGGGVKLDYVQGWWVIDRLNKVIGHGNWAYSSKLTLVHQGKITDRYGKDVFTCHYLAEVRLAITMGQVQTEFTDVGYGDGSDKMNPGKAHELAAKEAVTDGLKRCAKNLGMSFGLALYDKTQEFVSEEESPAPDARDAAIAEVREIAAGLIKQNKISNVLLQEYMKSKFGVIKSSELSVDQARSLKKHLAQVAQQ